MTLEASDKAPAAKRRRRAFAWASGSDSGADDEDRSSSASSSRSPVQASEETFPQTVAWHTTVAKTWAAYLDLRQRAASAAAAGEAKQPQAAALMPRPPPLGARVVARRAERVLRLRHMHPKPPAEQDSPPEWPSAALREVVLQLRGRGFVVADTFGGPALVEELLEGVSRLSMRRGHLGDDGAQSAAHRSDLIAWPEAGCASVFGLAVGR